MSRSRLRGNVGEASLAGVTSDERETIRGPHVIYLKNLARLQVQEAIERLPEAYREIIVLRDFEGLTCAVRWRLGRAQGKLREMLSSCQPKRRARSV